MEESLETQHLDYSETTRGIRVSVTPRFLDTESNMISGIYAFAYTVTLQNMSEAVVQLINRHWRVYSGNRQVADVKGEGVIGAQPVLEPGFSYQYTSSSIINDSAGYMIGSYTFRNERGEFFDVAIPKFDLFYVDQNQVH